MSSILDNLTGDAPPGVSLEQAHATLAGGPNVIPSGADNVTPPSSSKDALEHKLSIENSYTKLGYGSAAAGAMLREDDIIQHGMGWIVGHTEFNPDNNWRPTEASNWKELTTGIPEQYHGEFYNTTSQAHANYIRGNIMDKMKDQELLGTLDRAGQIGRFGLGVVNPSSLALGLATAGISKIAATVKGGMTLAGAAQAARVASKIVDPAVRAAEMAKAAAALGEAAAGGAKGTAVATGIVAGAGLGGGYEALRQGVGFEHDSNQVLSATLMGAAFSAPFAFVGARQMGKVTRAAALERDVLNIFERLHTGETLAAHDLETLRTYGYHVEEIKRQEAGGEIPHEEPPPNAPATGEHPPGDTPPTIPLGKDVVVDTPPEIPHEEPPPNAPATGEHPPGDTPPTVPLGKDVVVDTPSEIPHDVPAVDIPGATGAPKKDTVLTDVIPKGVDVANTSTNYGKGTGWIGRLRANLKSGAAVEVKQHATLRAIAPHFEGTAMAPIIARLLATKELTTRTFISHDNVTRNLQTGAMGGVHYGGEHNYAVTFVKSASELKNLGFDSAQVYLHELVHAHTVAALRGHIELNPKQVNAVIELNALFIHTKKWTEQRLIKNSKGKNFYGFTNVREFVAEAFSNAEFQKHLEQITVGKTETAGSRFWSQVKKVLGIGKEMDESAFKRAMVHTEQLIGSRLKETSRDSLNTHFIGGEAGSMDGLIDHAINTPQPLQPQPGTYMAFATIGGKKVPIRLDISAVLNRNPNPYISQLGHELVKDPIGNSKTKAQGITVSERKERLRRVTAGAVHYEMKQAFNDAAKAKNMNFAEKVRFMAEFYSNVTKVARGDTAIIRLNPELAPAYQRASKALRSFYDTMGKKALDSGLEGAENLPTGGNYVNRVYLHNKIREMSKLHGEDAVHQLFAEAFMAPGMKGNKDVGKAFTNAILKLEYRADVSDILLNGKDMGTLRTELTRHGLAAHDINAIVDVMFQKKAGSQSAVTGSLKHRIDLDEHATIQSNGQTLRMSDLLENDSRLLVDKYTNTMGGWISMAEHGIKSRSDWAARVEQANGWATGNAINTDPHTHVAGMKLIDDMFKHTVGEPMSTQTFSMGNRFFGAMRAYTRSVMLGQLGIAAGFEIKNAMALSAFHGTWSQIPSLRNIITMMRNGVAPADQLGVDIQHMLGFGNEYAMSYAREHEVSEFSYNRGLTKFENFANKASHVVDVISGNASFTAATRNLAAKFSIQHLFDISVGKNKMDAGFIERLVGQGIDSANIKATLADLNSHTIADQKGVVQHIDWEGWQQHDPKTYGDFSLAIERFTRDGIQDHNIGETMPWMHTTTGKIIGELRTFMMVAHAKQFLKNVHYRDRTAAMVFTTGFVGEMLAYSLQTSLNFAHNQEELNKRLTGDRIAKAAIQRLSTLGILSMVIDTPTQFATGHSFFGNGTNNTDNRNLLMTPSFMVLKRMMGTAQAATQAMSPLSDTITTKQEMNDAMGILPGVNTWGARNIVDFTSSHYPKSDPSQKPQHP